MDEIANFIVHDSSIYLVLSIRIQVVICFWDHSKPYLFGHDLIYFCNNRPQLRTIELVWIFDVSFKNDFVKQFSESGLLIAWLNWLWFKEFLATLCDDSIALIVGKLFHKVYQVTVIVDSSNDVVRFFNTFIWDVLVKSLQLFLNLALLLIYINCIFFSQFLNLLLENLGNCSLEEVLVALILM